MKDLSSVRISKSSLKIVKNLASRHGVTNRIWLDASVNFINKTGFDVLNYETKKNISVEDRIIGFLKKREQVYFKPMERYFVESKDLLTKVLKGLEDFGILDLMDKQNENFDKRELIIPNETKKIQRIEVENPVENLKGQNEFLDGNVTAESENLKSENEDLKLQLDKYKTEHNIFKKEINFLIKNIKPGGALSSSKYVINISSTDIKRINKLMENDY